MPHDWLSSEEVARELTLSVRSFYRLLASGHFPDGFRPLGPRGNRRWRRMDVEAWKRNAEAHSQEIQ